MPAFKNLNEIEEFWESHEFTRFQDEFSNVSDLEVNITNRTFLPVTLTIFQKLEKIAAVQQTAVNRLIHRCVEEKLAASELA